MKTQERIAMLPDVQSRADSGELHIDAVGIKSFRSPITIRAGERLLPTIATFLHGGGPVRGQEGHAHVPLY